MPLRVSSFVPLVAALGLACSAPAQAAGLPAWTLEMDAFTLGDTRATGVRIHSDAETADTMVSLSVESLRLSSDGMVIGPLSMECPGAIDAVLGELCASGAWRARVLPDWPPLEGNLALLEVSESLTRFGAEGSWDTVQWGAEIALAGSGVTVDVALPAQPVSNLAMASHLAPPLQWAGAGQFEATARVELPADEPARASGAIQVSGLDFDSPDGLYAGLGVGLQFDLNLPRLDRQEVTFQASILGGELLLHDFYRNFSDASLAASGNASLDEQVLQLSKLHVRDDGAIDLKAAMRLPMQDTAELEYQLDSLDLQFPAAYQRYFESVGAVYSLDGLQTSGGVRWRADEAPGAGLAGVLTLQDLGVDDAQRQRFSITGLDGELRTGADSVLTWRGASLVKMDLGAGEAHLGVSPQSLELRQPLSIPLFGGRFVLQELSVSEPAEAGGDAPVDIVLNAALDAIDMQQMSSALGWPEFAGSLSGRIPGVSWSGDVLEIDGDLEFNVFDGNVVLSDLRVERLFGVLPSLAANIEASGLDLQLLTQTFEFGRIAGRIDGYVRNLRMLDWEPVRFDAWFGTPDDSERNDISRQAVRHLTEIGGGSPTAMLSGPVLRLFNDFSYRRIGLGCILRDNICQIRGVEEQGDAVLLLEGAGIPKISILAFNRQVDWPQFVADLGAATSGEEVRIGN